MPKHGRKFWYDLFARDVFYSGTHLYLWLKGSAYLLLFTFKERNSGLFCSIFLKFTFDNFTSPVGLAILKLYLPGPNFTSLGHRACTIFRRLLFAFVMWPSLFHYGAFIILLCNTLKISFHRKPRKIFWTVFTSHIHKRTKYCMTLYCPLTVGTANVILPGENFGIGIERTPLWGCSSVILLRSKMGVEPPKHDVISMPTQQYTNTNYISLAVSSCSFHYAEICGTNQNIQWQFDLLRSENQQNFWEWLTVLCSQMQQVFINIPTISGVSKWSIFPSLENLERIKGFTEQILRHQRHRARIGFWRFTKWLLNTCAP